MHVVFRESHGLEEGDTPFDPGQDPADLVVLSFSDTDLGAFAEAWDTMSDGADATLRLQNLVALRHPVSVDTYLDRTLGSARAILIRLIGGQGYWPYGLASVQDLARKRGIALAVLPADGRPDPALEAASTLPQALLHRLAALCDAGGARAAHAALALLAEAGGIALPRPQDDRPLPQTGWYARRPASSSARKYPGGDQTGLRGWWGAAPPAASVPDLPLAVVTFYRSALASADMAAIDALIDALAARGFHALGLFAPSLKGASAGWVADQLRAALPAAIVNATAFSAREGDASPLDAPGCPVHQVALSTARRRDWADALRGLSPADLAMYVVLPEVDGRLFAGVASFKSPGRRDPATQFSRFTHRPDARRVAAIADRVAAWHRLGATAAGDRRLALILSTYPGRPDQIAHAVGLDALASADAILTALGKAGHATEVTAPLAPALARETLDWPLDAYRAALATLPPTLRDDLQAAWGAPEDDPACQNGAFRFAATRRGNAIVALQPERGAATDRTDSYHDLTRTPRHGYVAFYLWLRAQGLHAAIHIGAHGTLEWLPGKAVALGSDCWPEALIGDLPLIYPFIVNDPGEAAQAKRRVGALTLGHVPPPLIAAGVPEALAGLEQLLDEYSTADGLDPARRARLIGDIRTAAQGAGVEADLALPHDASAAEAIPRIDAFLCDLKESRFGDGLHVYGQAQGEIEGLLAAVAGCRVSAGPAGSPARGRTDVLPTGRNLFAVDPRAVPTRAAHAQGVKLAEELLRRHLQDQGDWPRGLILDLWGSASMRTGGEEFAMALHLAGLVPEWDAATGRVTGVAILPGAELGRPRIDVTLRVSGLFRDVFPDLATMWMLGIAALAAREGEDAADNPYAAAPGARLYGPQPGSYGVGMGDPADLSLAARHAAGEAWLAASSWALDGQGGATADRRGLTSRLAAADAVAHVQDLAETDLLMAPDFAAHQAGPLAAAAALGLPQPTAWHLDTSRPDAPRARALTEEIARAVRARAANPAWATGMMRHGFRGAAEIAATLDNLASFAALGRGVPGHLFDLYHDATLGREAVMEFMARENPAALAALRDRFDALREAGLWHTARNAMTAEERL